MVTLNNGVLEVVRGRGTEHDLGDTQYEMITNHFSEYAFVYLDELPQYRLTINLSPNNVQGLTSTGAGLYYAGRVPREVSANSTASGYRFDHWEEAGQANVTDNPYPNLVMNSNRTLTAVFVQTNANNANNNAGTGSSNTDNAASTNTSGTTDTSGTGTSGSGTGTSSGSTDSSGNTTSSGNTDSSGNTTSSGNTDTSGNTTSSGNTDSSGNTTSSGDTSGTTSGTGASGTTDTSGTGASGTTSGSTNTSGITSGTTSGTGTSGTTSGTGTSGTTSGTGTTSGIYSQGKNASDMPRTGIFDEAAPYKKAGSILFAAFGGIELLLSFNRRKRNARTAK